MWKIGLLVAIFFLIGAFAQENANLVVFKQVVSKEVVTGKPVSVNIKLFNTGAGAAYDVRVDDKNWSTFELVNGSYETKIERIPAGTNVTHTFSVRPTVVGEFVSSPAKVVYRQTSKSEHPQVGYSNNLGSLIVESLASFEKRTDPHYKDWAIFAVLSFLAIGPAGFIWNSSSGKIQGKGKKSN